MADDPKIKTFIDEQVLVYNRLLTVGDFALDWMDNAISNIKKQAEEQRNPELKSSTDEILSVHAQILKTYVHIVHMSFVNKPFYQALGYNIVETPAFDRLLYNRTNLESEIRSLLGEK